MPTSKDYTMKYDKRGIGPAKLAEKLHPGEPWFYIRAQDKLSVDAVRAYGDLLAQASNGERKRGNEVLADELLKQAIGITRVSEAFMNWQEANPDKVKLPD